MIVLGPRPGEGVRGHGHWCTPANCEVEKSWEPHYSHGLRPWRTCRWCFRGSVSAFIVLPVLMRWWALKFRVLGFIRPFGYSDRHGDFRREWLWDRSR